MSVTFNVGRGNRSSYVACATCGTNPPNYGNQDCSAVHPGSLYPCMGYGFTIEDTTFPQMNVSNTNAYAILVELLGRPDLATDELSGELDPGQVLLALGAADKTCLVRESLTLHTTTLSWDGVGTGTMTVCGVDEEQAARYERNLRVIALRALAEGVPIMFD